MNQIPKPKNELQSDSNCHTSLTSNTNPPPPLLLEHHPRQKPPLRIQRTRTLEHIKLEIMPLLRRPHLARRIPKGDIIIRPQKIRNTVTVLLLRLLQRHNAMDHTGQLPTRREAQTIAHIDDSVASTRLDEFPALRLGGAVLQTPLRRKQEGQRANVGVLVVADAGGFADSGLMLGVT